MNSQFSALISSGDLDESFNGGRVLTFRFYEGETAAAYDVAIGSDRRIYIAGTVEGRFAIVVLNPDGSFAEDFAFNGILLDSFFGAERSTGFRIAVDDDRVRILGTTQVLKEGVIRYCPAVASYRLNGVRDTAYGSDGYQVIDPDFADGDLRFMEPRWAPNWSFDNGKTYVAAFRLANGLSTVLTCLDRNGQFDKQFGVAGTGTVNIKHPRGAQLDRVRATPEGIYLAGSVDGADGVGALCRVSLRGEVDSSYGEDGFTVFEGHYSEVKSLPDTGNPTLLTVGRHADIESGDFIRHRGALRSFVVDGSPDKKFNNGDPVFTEINYSTDWYHGAVQEDGRILAMGYASDPRPSDVLQSRDVLTPARYNEMSENRVLPSSSLALCRFLSDGALDSSFGREHKGWIAFNINENAYTGGIAMQEDNAVVVVGTTGDGRVYVVRFKG